MQRLGKLIAISGHENFPQSSACRPLNFSPKKKYKIVISWQAPTLICPANYLWPYTLRDPARPNWGGQTPPKLTESRSGLSWKLSSISSPPTSFVQSRPDPALDCTCLVWSRLSSGNLCNFTKFWAEALRHSLTQAKTRSWSWCDLLQFSRPVIPPPPSHSVS